MYKDCHTPWNEKHLKNSFPSRSQFSSHGRIGSVCRCIWRDRVLYDTLVVPGSEWASFVRVKECLTRVVGGGRRQVKSRILWMQSSLISVARGINGSEKKRNGRCVRLQEWAANREHTFWTLRLDSGDSETWSGPSVFNSRVLDRDLDRDCGSLWHCLVPK